MLDGEEIAGVAGVSFSDKAEELLSWVQKEWQNGESYTPERIVARALHSWRGEVHEGPKLASVAKLVLGEEALEIVVQAATELKCDSKAVVEMALEKFRAELVQYSWTHVIKNFPPGKPIYPKKGSTVKN